MDNELLLKNIVDMMDEKLGVEFESRLENTRNWLQNIQAKWKTNEKL